MLYFNNKDSGFTQQIDRLGSIISKQDQVFTTFTITHNTLDMASANTNLLAKLLDKINSHDTQLLSFVKVSAKVSGFKAEVETFAESLTQLRTTTITLSTMNDKLNHHEFLFTQLREFPLSIKEMLKAIHTHKDRIKEVHRAVKGGKVTQTAVLTSEGKVKDI
jgi:hypothetical protein